MRTLLAGIALLTFALYVAAQPGGLASAIAGREAAPAKAEPEKPVWTKALLPEKAVEFLSSPYTQEIAVTNGFDRISKVYRTGLEAKWQVSGGMVGIKGVTSKKYALVAPKSFHWIDNIQVLNSLGYYQPNRGIVRKYGDGTRFDDVLYYQGKVFEHRVREKLDGRWKSTVIFRDHEARPAGYTGLKVTCASCHEEAGSGGYAAGLVPGGDTVISHPLDWSLVGQ